MEKNVGIYLQRIFCPNCQRMFEPNDNEEFTFKYDKEKEVWSLIHINCK